MFWLPPYAKPSCICAIFDLKIFKNNIWYCSDVYGCIGCVCVCDLFWASVLHSLYFRELKTQIWHSSWSLMLSLWEYYFDHCYPIFQSSSNIDISTTGASVVNGVSYLWPNWVLGKPPFSIWKHKKKLLL